MRCLIHSLIWTAVLIGGLAACASAQTKAERIHELMSHYHALGRQHGAVLVAHGGEVIYEGGFGPADATWGIPNAPDVKYDISSVTKHFTGLLVMQQVEREAIRLDAPAANYLRAFPVPIDERITIAHLLLHQSGIPDFANDLSGEEFEARYLHRRQPPDSVVADMLRRPLEFEPGAEHDYSNTGYVLLGLILEAVTGRDYCDLLRAEVLEPAGMSDSGCSRFEPVIPRRATGYRMEDGHLIHAAYWHSSYADGEMYSTVRDLYRLDQALRSGRLLSPEMQAVMNAPRVENDWIGDDFGPGLKHYTGYGIESVHRRPAFAGADSVTVVGHGGGGGGFTSMLWRVPEDGVVIAVLNNVEAPPLYPELFDILYDRPYRLPTATATTEAWLSSNAIRLETVEAGTGFDDMQPLREVVGDARIVSFGEPTHGNREVFQLKHRMIEFLVTEMGFDVFALESPMAETFDLNEYVLTGVGDPARALAGIYYWVWDTEEVLEMIEWIRSYNADPANARKVRFYGFDMQDPERAARVALDYLRGVDPELAEAILPALGIFATPFTLPEFGGRRQLIPREGDTRTVQAIDTVLSGLDSRKDDYIAASSASEWSLARQHARLLAQYIEASQDEGSDWGAVRDRAMAENVRWILEQEGQDAKAIIWAHNSHVADHAPFGFDLQGSHLRRMYGPEMVIFGFLFNKGSFLALDAGSPSEGMRTFTVGPAPEGTVEALFASAGLELAVVDLRQIPNDGPVEAWFSEPRATRHSGAGYNAANPARYLLEYTLPEAFDALVYVNETTPVRPVNEADYDVLWLRELRLPSPVNLDFEASASGEAPEGWLAWSKHRRLGFEMITTSVQAYQGTRSAVIRRPPGQHYGEAAGSLSQRIDAAPYRGKTIHLRAAAKAAPADDGSFVFLRLAIDGPVPQSVHDPAAPIFDSLADHRVTSADWQVDEIVAPVPDDAAVISYGLFLAGEGSAWIDDAAVEVIDR